MATKSPSCSTLISAAYAHAIELAREGVALNVVQRQLDHCNLGVPSIYLQGIDPDVIV